MHTVFHLAADHGGRGYVSTCQAGPATNLSLDAVVFRAAARESVAKVVFASSACVYPNYLQMDPSATISLREADVGPPFDPDQMYGFAKLSAEMALRAFHQEWGLPSVSCRYFSVYGPRATEDHAVIAMISRAFVGQDPYEIWGRGNQIRSWTYVDDIVEGTLLAAERVHDATAVNLGSSEGVVVADAARMTLEITGHRAEIVALPYMPRSTCRRILSGQRRSAAPVDGLRGPAPGTDDRRRAPRSPTSAMMWCDGSRPAPS